VNNRCKVNREKRSKKKRFSMSMSEAEAYALERMFADRQARAGDAALQGAVYSRLTGQLTRHESATHQAVMADAQELSS